MVLISWSILLCLKLCSGDVSVEGIVGKVAACMVSLKPPVAIVDFDTSAEGMSMLLRSLLGLVEVPFSVSYVSSGKTY